MAKALGFKVEIAALTPDIVIPLHAIRGGTQYLRATIEGEALICSLRSLLSAFRALKGAVVHR